MAKPTEEQSKRPSKEERRESSRKETGGPNGYASSAQAAGAIRVRRGSR
jgi:hypothetical protein